jgi:ATP-dependent Lhr-like helicase
MPVHRRHGDVAASERKRLYADPDGILLITPESVEALFVNQGTLVPKLLNGLRFVVVDEMHSFVGTERGAQLQSLLHRIELAIRRRVPRIGLSATIANPASAAEFLVPGKGEEVTLIGGTADDRAELRMQLRGYLIASPGGNRNQEEVANVADDAGSDLVANPEPEEESSDEIAITEHLFQTLRNSDNLVFANSRNYVEKYADKLKRISENRHVPNVFFPHHGSLSKALREDVEQRLKSTEQPATAICTSTLEMGIDIGSADSVAQIGSPGSVSALRQRLGRSGRRGNPAVLRVYTSEVEITPQTAPVDLLRAETFESIAIIELLLEKWYEPPNVASLHLSTLIQQMLSVIAQHGGATAAELFSALCVHGPFQRVDKAMFLQLLRDMGENDLITQAADGTLLHGGTGEQLVNHYSFYTAFLTAEEFRLVANGRTLGSIPIDYPVEVGGLIVFAGQRWRVIAIDDVAKVIELVRAHGGNPPHFTGPGIQIADGIRQKMREVYEGTTVPVYLDTTGVRFLKEGRASYRQLRLDRSPLLQIGNDVIIFPWRGDIVLNKL